jgi:hypothetical protein
MSTQTLYTQLDAIQQKLFNIAASNAFVRVVVDYRSQLPDVNPPAIAYVREDGNYYLKYYTDPAFEGTPYYSKHGNGWHPLDVSSPRFDRPIHVINTRWVVVNGFQQDLDLMVNLYNENGLEQAQIDVMTASIPTPITGGRIDAVGGYPIGTTQLNVKDFTGPIDIGSMVRISSSPMVYTIVARAPSSDAPLYIEISPGLIQAVNNNAAITFLPVTNLGVLPPSHFILRVGREDMSNPFSEIKVDNNTWYMTTVECAPGHSLDPECRLRKCWNLSCITPLILNPPARFDRVIHGIEAETVLVRDGEAVVEKTVQEVLQDQKRIIPGDLLFDNRLQNPELSTPVRNRRWEYLAPNINEPTQLIPFEFARVLTVMSRAEFDEINQYFQLTRIYVVNMSHGKQSWERYLPSGIDEHGEIQMARWDRRHHPAELCYWADET